MKMLVNFVVFLCLLGIDKASSDTCPTPCTCNSDLTVVTCINRKLTSIPPNLPKSVQKLDLSSNSITEILASSLAGLTNLTYYVKLQGNYIVEIQDGAFDDQGLLKDLYLTNNRLASEEVGDKAFRGLRSLQHLYLTQNSLSRIPDVVHMPNLLTLVLDTNQITNGTFPPSFSTVAKFQSITLSNNKLTTLTSGMFASVNMSTLTYLGLSRNKIKEASPGIFKRFSSLRSLSISYNPLTKEALANVLDSLQNTSLESLDMDGIVLYQLPPTVFDSFCQLPMKSMSMSRSNKWTIRNATFSCLPTLKYLDLTYSKMATVEPGAFTGLDSLQRLRLGYNTFEEVPKDLPTSLEVLDLSNNNNIEKLDAFSFLHLSSLTNLSLSHCTKIRVLSGDALVGLSSLVSLDMSVNAIGGSSIPATFLQPVSKLRSLNLSRNKLSIMRTDYKLFSHSTSLLELDMSENQCHVLPVGLFQSLTALKTLDLHGNKLSNVLANKTSRSIFWGLANVTVLDLHNNGIRYLPEETFEKMSALQELHLDDNAVSGWDQGTFAGLPSLKFLNLTSNRISLVNETSMEGLENGVSIDLTDNPFSCWCDLVWFRHFMDQPNVTFVNSNHYVCNSPERYATKPVLSFQPEDIEKDCKTLPLILIICCSVGGAVVLIMATGLSLYRYRWEIRLRIYLFKRKRRLRAFRTNSEGYQPLDGEETVYNFCILYDGNQTAWVKDPLVEAITRETGDNPEAEDQDHGERGGGWKVFFEDGNVGANETSFEAVAEAVYHSQRSILILSREFVASAKCTVYLKSMAFENAFERKLDLDGIILILFGSNSRVYAQEDKFLSRIIKEEREIVWPDDDDAGVEAGRALFWEKLKDQLDAHPVPVNIQMPV